MLQFRNLSRKLLVQTPCGLMTYTFHPVSNCSMKNITFLYDQILTMLWKIFHSLESTTSQTSMLQIFSYQWDKCFFSFITKQMQWNKFSLLQSHKIRVNVISFQTQLYTERLLGCNSPSKLLYWPLMDACKVRPDSLTWVSNSRLLRFRRFSSIPVVQQV